MGEWVSKLRHQRLLPILTGKYRNLTAWASNGVLMLNTCLTVRAGDAGSHSNKGWEEFTDKVVDVVDKYGGANLPSSGDGANNSGIGRGVVFLAWGAWAAKRVAKLNKVSLFLYSKAATLYSPYIWLSVDEASHSDERCKFLSCFLDRFTCRHL